MVSYDPYQQLKAAVSTYGHSIPLQNLQHLVEEIATRLLPSHNDLPPLRAIYSCRHMEDVLRLLEKWALLSPTKVDVLSHLCDNFMTCSPQLLDTFKSYKMSLSNSSSNLCAGGGRAMPWSAYQQCPCISLPAIAASLPPMHPPPPPSNSSASSSFSFSTFSSYTSAAEFPYNDASQREEEIATDYCEMVEYLSEELGRQWSDVGRRLPGMRSTTRAIADDHALRARDKAVTMLEQHYRRNTVDAVPSLLEALRACNLNKQADHIKSTILRPEGTAAGSAEAAGGPSHHHHRHQQQQQHEYQLLQD